jgi:NADPH:quinone reductase-like Zn-dependent oxidoreductase
MPPIRQKSLVVVEPKGELTIQITDVPQPAAGEILVRVEAAALNSMDWKIHAYGMALESYPAVLGSDGAGVVQAVGENITRFSPGDRVWVFKELCHVRSY